MKWIDIGCRLSATKRLVICLTLAIFAHGLLPGANAQAAKQSPALREFLEAYEQIRSRYVDRLDEGRLLADAIRGMVANLDPFSDYLDSDAYDDLRRETGGTFGGLGMEVSMEGSAVKVITAFEDSPAYHAGLRPGDLITRLGESDIAGLTLEQVIQRARGEPDTSIALTVLRRGDTEPRIVTIRRAIIPARSVKIASIDDAYVYLRVTDFHRQTANLLFAALETAYPRPDALKGVILDLRDNPGGVLGSAVAVSAIFLPQDALVVYTESASELSRMRLVANAHVDPDEPGQSRPLLAVLKRVPLVVLVNGGSASAAEIVAGSLQSHNRATLVGARTFGKGSVQAVFPLGDGSALKLTTAYYHTPDGRRIEGSGVVPDIPVEQPAEGSAAVCLRADALVASASPTELSNPGIAAIPDCQFARALGFLRHLREFPGR